MECKKDYIYRKSYTRTTKSGKVIRVKGSCIKSTSITGRKRSVINKRIRKSAERSHKKAEKKTGTLDLKCPKGTIKRAGYVRKSYTRTSRTGKTSRVKRAIVPASCIKSRGVGSKVRLGPLIKGELGEFGYDNVITLATRTRHASLNRAVKEYGYLPVIKKLNALYILNRNRNSKDAEIFKTDQVWLSEKYAKVPEKSAVRVKYVKRRI